MKTIIDRNCTSTSLEISSDLVDRLYPRLKGSYQRDFLCGLARVSGSDLRGKARKYSGSYRRSRERVIQTILDSGVSLVRVIGKNNRVSIRSET